MKSVTAWAGIGLMIGIGSVEAQAETVAQTVDLELRSSYVQWMSGSEKTEAFAARANQLSNGALRIFVAIDQTPGFTVRQQHIFSSIKGREVALASFEAPLVARIDPIFRLSSLPMLAGSFEEARELLAVARSGYESSLAKHNQRLLFAMAYQPVLLWTKLPIASAHDLAGLGFNAARTEWIAALTRSGARESGAASTDLLVAHPRNPSVAIYGQTFKHATEVFWALPLQFITINASVFDALLPSARDALLAAGRELEEASWAAAKATAAREYADIAARGVSVQVTPPDGLIRSLREAAEPDVRAWAVEVGTTGSEILKEYRSRVRH